MRAQVIVLVVVAVTALCLFGWLLGSSDNIGHEEPCNPRVDPSSRLAVNHAAHIPDPTPYLIDPIDPLPLNLLRINHRTRTMFSLTNAKIKPSTLFWLIAVSWL